MLLRLPDSLKLVSLSLEISECNIGIMCVKFIIGHKN